MQILVQVDASAAIRNGKAQAGVIGIEITEEFLASLTSEQRDLLSRQPGLNDPSARGGSLIGAKYGGDVGHGIALAEPTLSELTAWLSAALAQEQADKVEKAERERQDAERRAEIERQEQAEARAWATLPLAVRSSRHGGPATCLPPDVTLDDVRAGKAALVTSGRQVASSEQLRRRAPVEWAEAEAESARLAKVAESAKEAAKAAQRQTILDWIAAHGSVRLRLAVEAELLDQSLAVYRDERLAVERPGWEWDLTAEEEEVLNPSEAELRALIRARKIDPDVRLMSVRGADDEETGEVHRWEHALQSDFLGREILHTIE